MAPTVSAANVCTDTVKGDAESKTTFTVTTEGKWYRATTIKLTQNGKGTALNVNFDTYKIYGQYKVSYVSTDGKDRKNNINFTGKNMTLHLKKNKTYTITIEPWSQQKMRNKYTWTKGGFLGWEEVPTWKVKSTGGNIIICG